MPSGVKISEEQKDNILNLWLQGYTYKIINTKTSVSPAAISGVIKKFLETQPDLSKLRELSLTLKKTGVSHLECIRGAKFLEKLNALNVSLKELDPILNFCRAMGDPVKAAGAGLEMASLKERTGKTYMEILDDYATIYAEHKHVTQQLKEEKQDLKNTRKQLISAKTLEELQKQLNLLGLSPERLKKFIQNSTQIEANGFTPEVSVILSRELKSLGLTPAKAVKKIINIIAQYGSLAGSIQTSLKAKVALNESIYILKTEKKRLATQYVLQENIIQKAQTRIVNLQREIKQLETRHDKRMQTLDRNYDTQVLFHKDKLRSINQEIDEVKTQRKIIKMSLINLTKVKGNIETYIDLGYTLHDRIKVQLKQVDEESQKRLEIRAEIKAMQNQLEAKNAWFNYLLSGTIPSWDSTFWKDLETMFKVKRGELPPTPYIKPASEAVRKRMINIYQRMVKEDIADQWAYQRLKEKNNQLEENLNQLEENLKKEHDGRAEEYKKKKSTEAQLKTFTDNWEVRVNEEVSNRLNYRMSTKRCRQCKSIFLVDKTVQVKGSGYTCPYCIFSFGVEDFPYSIYHFRNKAVILVSILDQKTENILVEATSEKVTIKSKDRSHHIEVSLKTYEKPIIAEKTYNKGVLKVTVKKGFEKPKHHTKMSRYVAIRTPN